MPQETIEFIIHPDGTIEERTLGLKGEACEQITAPIEGALGQVTAREATAERYEQAGDETETQQESGLT
ncbi:MAG: DUF2997 domain-containing protein [Armatimonadetes bacterium]|nr:DUF2997 domain-containing protein [Armatimonadota bacterium]